MNRNHFDCIIIGAGSMGSSAAYYLSRSGLQVLCLDQFATPHSFGSHGGQSRIIRKAYFEHEAYVPLLNKAYDNWRKLEDTSGVKLFYPTGLLYLGPDDSQILQGIKYAANLHDIDLLHVDSEKHNLSFDMIHIPDGFQVILEPDAGFVLPGPGISTLKSLADKYGACFQQHETVLDWSMDHNMIKVVTKQSTYTAGKLVICAGAWSESMLFSLKLNLKVSRQFVAWFDAGDNADFQLGNLPCYMIDDFEGLFYGFPVLPKQGFIGPHGLKIAHHMMSEFSELPDSHIQNHKMSREEEKLLSRIVSKYFPRVSSNIIDQTVCYYTNSDDANFIIDYYPGTDNQVVLACGFSGHGFKFVPAIGEILKDLVLDRDIGLDLEFLSMSRFERL